MSPPSQARESARQEIPPELRRDVRVLGAVLGAVIADYGGKALLRDVEHLRRLAIRARDDGRYERAAERLVASWPLERAEQVTRAFTCYFHLANLAEEHHRARVIRERGRDPAPIPESIAATVPAVTKKIGARRARQLVSELRIHPVFTAHPTEARRRAVVTAIRRIGDQLERLNDPRASHDERMDGERRLAEEIDTLWRTAQIRIAQVQPLDEVRSFMAVFDETLFRIVPELSRTLDRAFIRFGTWIGGDRDGNPAVTADVTAAAMAIQAEHALLALETAAARIGRTLTAESGTTPPSTALRRRVASARPDLVTRSADEPHRVFLLDVANRLAATRIGEGERGYRSPKELLRDLQLLHDSLERAGAARLARGEVQNLIWQAETFGFHCAELEVRQHSSAHAQALSEVRAGNVSAGTRDLLDTMRVIASLQRRFGAEACGRYVVSFTRTSDDIAAVYELAEHATGGRPPRLEVIPLFETLDDLRRATGVLDGMLALPPVRRNLAASGRSLEVMLGYSDSAKEAGPLAATLALHDAQAAMTAWAKRNRVRLILFHGRGGALGRGGGPANRAVRAQAPGSVAGYFKVTEQGEVIFARYGNQAIARRHLEQVTSAVLEASAAPKRSDPASRFAPVAGLIGPASHKAYRALVDAPGFEEWFARVSPIDELGRLRIASRPARRATGHRLEDLRAIPWVFAWSQMRLNLPGWYGIGSGLAAARPSDLRRAYAEWPLFNVMLDNAEMSLAKTDRRIAQRYLALGDRADLTAMVLREYDLTLEQVLAVTGHRRLLEDRRVLSWAIELRNPYVDALSHLQLRALRALRDPKTTRAQRARAENVFQLSANGVAAGLQNTG